MKIKIVNKSNNKLPEYSTEQSAGVDLRAYIIKKINLKPLERTLVPKVYLLNCQMDMRHKFDQEAEWQ